ncbi:MAG: hypothetical protein PHS57_01140 [Alphaproteobacteria bacterium]|nr:hypothetical protein [Alphaproteobacteria bacterium]
MQTKRMYLAGGSRTAITKGALCPLCYGECECGERPAGFDNFQERQARCAQARRENGHFASGPAAPQRNPIPQKLLGEHREPQLIAGLRLSMSAWSPPAPF